MAKLKKTKTTNTKSSAYKTKAQAKAVAKMTSAQAKLVRSQAKSNVIKAKQGRMIERHKSIRIAAIANAAASPWNTIINNSNSTGNYQTGTIGETPKEESPKPSEWAPRG